MEFKRTESEVLIRLDDGDDIIGSLKEVCKKERIESGLIVGIGAARKAEIAHYDTKKKKYNIRKLEGMLEIVSLKGNVAMLDGEPALHLHIILSMHDYSTLSGHLMGAEICPTCEITLIPYKAKIERRFDEKTGLNLQRF
jgi:predicted DNA-binding protein with PD1-like motif